MKKTFILLIIMTLMFAMFTTDNLYVKASMEQTIYTENFDEIAIGTKNFSTYAEGEEWFNVTYWKQITGSNMPQVRATDVTWKEDYGGHVYSIYTPTGYQKAYTNISFYKNFETIQFQTARFGSTNSYVQMQFKSGNDVQITVYHGNDNVDGDLQVNVGGVDIVTNMTVEDVILNHRIWFWFGNSTVGYQYSANDDPIDGTAYYTGTPDDFGYPNYCRVTFSTHNDVALWSAMNNFSCWLGEEDTGNPWDIDYDSYGNVDKVPDGWIEARYSWYLTYVMETDRTSSEDYYIKQVAVAVDDDSDLDDCDIFCRVNGVTSGTYNDFYYHQGRYFLVWENLNVYVDFEDILIEFKVLYDNPDTKKVYFFTHSLHDADEDGDIELKRSASDYYYNGIYDGQWTNSEDLIYEVWFEDADEEPPPQEGAFYIKLRDIATGEDLQLIGTRCYDYPSDDWVQSAFKSSLWSGEYYYDCSYGKTITIQATFDNGDYHWLNFTGAFEDEFEGKVNGEEITFKGLHKRQKMYKGQTYYIYLEPEGWTSDPDWEWCDRLEFGNFWDKYMGWICLDSPVYDYGETVQILYKLPSRKWLHDRGLPSNGWKMDIKEEKGIFDEVKYTFYQSKGELIFDGEYHTNLEFDADADYGIETYYADYYFHFINDQWGIYNEPQTKYWTCTGSAFEPTGEIVSVSPANPYIGQGVEIGITANNKGHLDILHVPSQKIVFTETFEKFDGVLTITTYPHLLGYHEISLYVHPWNNESRDTDDFLVTEYGGNYSDLGYDIEYLYIPDYRYIAGFDNVTIYYNTFKTDSKLYIYSPKGSTTFYSTSLDKAYGKYEFKTDIWMDIGIWTVRLEALNDTLNESFNIIAQEHNWIEFSKNVFYTDEYFKVIVKHNLRVILVFKKWDESLDIYIPQGEDTLIEAHVDIDTVKVIKNVPLTEGSWKVEMWEVNDRVRERKLAEWECSVITRPPVYDFEQPSVLPKLDMVMGAIVGMIVTLFCLLAPLMVAKGLHVKTGIPPMVYSMSGSIGVIVCVLFGWFPIWALIFVLLVAIIMIAMQYIIKQKGSSDGG